MICGKYSWYVTVYFKAVARYYLYSRNNDIVCNAVKYLFCCSGVSAN